MVTRREKGGGIVREFGIDIYTPIYIKWITNKNLLYKKKIQSKQKERNKFFKRAVNKIANKKTVEKHTIKPKLHFSNVLIKSTNT